MPDLFAPTRRRHLLSGIAAAPLILPQLLHAQPGIDGRLETALRAHFEYSAGFREKLRTGYYQRGLGRIGSRELAGIVPTLQQRLARLRQPSLALIHHVDAQGHLLAWLIGSAGVVTVSRSAKPYRKLGYLRDALDVDARMQTRSATRKGREEPNRAALLGSQSEDQDNVSGPLARAQALEFAADQLLGPSIRDELAGFRGRLLVLPVGDTGTAPYAALPLRPNRVLCDAIATVIIPDIHTLLNQRLVHRQSEIDWGRSLVFGDPDLRYDPEFDFPRLGGARREAVEIARLLRVSGPRFALGPNASLERFVRHAARWPSPGFIHLASHAVSNEVNPMDGSFVGLSRERLTGQLMRSDLFRPWEVIHPVVILSGCQTALGKEFKGGTYGISRAFFAAGAAQVISSLWNVGDFATYTLMRQAVRHMRGGMPAEFAIQTSQSALARQFRNDPAQWASFNVFGLPATGSTLPERRGRQTVQDDGS